MTKESKKTMLLIMDGWGLGDASYADAIHYAKTPFYDSLHHQYASSKLITCGEAVGLPQGQMGNSEVGHLNIGAGRVVYQDLLRVDQSLRENTLLTNQTIINLLSYIREKKVPLHLMGLVSDGGVHSHITHLFGLLDLFADQGVEQVFVHVFTDGRDTDPRSGLNFIKRLETHCEKTKATIASVSGRYYAMDRDKRWERVKKTYDILVHGQGNSARTALDVVLQSYDADVTDEFILPTAITDEQGIPKALIQPGDAVLCFNFRTDRCREITQVLTQQHMEEYAMKVLPLHYVTMTNYNKNYHNVHAIFDESYIVNTMGEVLANHGKRQVRIAETEKYPHVTFFFSGGREEPFANESRIIIPSPKVATYDLMPEMSAMRITESIVPLIQLREPDFICLNFANPDMVGHTGVWEAVIKALEVVDYCVASVVEACLQNDYAVFLTADHGNADHMKNSDGSPNTAHSLNSVPFFLIDSSYQGKLQDGKLGDLAPSILHYMGLPIPLEMTGKILLTT